MGKKKTPILICYKFKFEAKLLQEIIDAEKTCVFDGSVDMINAWNNKEIPIMLIQPQSCRAGLNLQKGGHNLIWFSTTPNQEHYTQTNARIYRKGQNENVNIYRIYAKNTVDEKYLKLVEQKAINENNTLIKMKK